MANLPNNNNNNIHGAIEYDEALTNQIGLRAQYIRILRQEYTMTHGNNIPPLNFDAGITEDDRTQRLNLAHKPLYVHAERSQGYNKPYTFAEERRDDNRAFEIEIKKAQLLNIPPLRLTEVRKIKPKDKQLINSYFRDFYKDRTEHNKALERARQRRAEQDAL
eukprot:g11630.t1